MIQTLVSLLETRKLEFQDESSVGRALYLYQENKSDFADCVHLASAPSHNQGPLITFDKQFSKLQGVQLLSI